jgi:hypothetical protein
MYTKKKALRKTGDAFDPRQGQITGSFENGN